MSHYCRDVQLFHNKFGHITPSDFTFLNEDLHKFRVGFFYEELNEYEDSVTKGDLGTAIDSLIDLVYIACGTSLFHGIGFDKFSEEIVESSLPHADVLPEYAPSGKPQFVSPEVHIAFIKAMNNAIEEYSIAAQSKDKAGIKKHLGRIYINSLFHSTRMGLTNAQWDEMWADVQRANMSKERATNPTQSKRGSTYDIFKPEGWIPPRTEELVAKYIAESNGTV